MVSGLVHARSKPQVPLVLASPNMEHKSQLLSLKEPLTYDYSQLTSYLDYFVQKHFAGLVLPCRHPCHTQETWDPCEVVKSQLPCSQQLISHILASNDLGPV